MLVPASAIGSLSIILVVGLSALGILNRVNLAIGELVARGKSGGYPKALPEWSVWLAASFFGLGLAFAILSVPSVWRRVILWISSVVLVAAWAPVLSLAAHEPHIGAPLIATLWSGVCALVYASNHQMACDDPAITADTSHAPR